MTKQTCRICDTLRNDTDDGDECVQCGATYMDPIRRSIAHTPAIGKPALALTSAVARGKIPAHRQPGWFHNVRMASGGLDSRRRGR